MAVSAEWIKRVMGAPDSVTAKLVAMRRKPGEGQLETGVWYSDFTRVKTEAERRGLPFFAMWTNGDVCGFCRRFTENILEPSFMKYMRASGGLWWLGGSMDDGGEDGRNGVGYKWCLAPDEHVMYFPFMAVSAVKDGKRSAFFGSGHDYDGGNRAPTGTSRVVAKLREFAPEILVTHTPTPVKRQSARTGSGGLLHIRINPDWDAAHIARFQSALRDNGGHCVCQPASPDTMCMCRAFLEQKKPGLCHCGAFEKYLV